MRRKLFTPLLKARTGQGKSSSLFAQAAEAVLVAAEVIWLSLQKAVTSRVEKILPAEVVQTLRSMLRTF